MAYTGWHLLIKKTLRRVGQQMEHALNGFHQHLSAGCIDFLSLDCCTCVDMASLAKERIRSTAVTLQSTPRHTRFVSFDYSNNPNDYGKDHSMNSADKHLRQIALLF